MVKHYTDIRIFESKTADNYLSLLASIPPQLSVAEFVEILKTCTAKALRDKFRFLSRLYYGNGEIWSMGCLVSTREVDEDVIREYVRRQGSEDHGQACFLF